MKKCFFIFSFFLIGFALNAQSDSLRVADSIELKPFLIEDHSIFFVRKGDLNGDGLQDIILVQQDTKIETIEEGPRPLLLLLRQTDGKLKLEKRNDTAVSCMACGGVWGDPFNSIEITDKGFSVSHYGGSAWRWWNIATFEYNADLENWLLSEVENGSMNTMMSDEEANTTITTAKNFGEILFEQYKGQE